MKISKWYIPLIVLLSIGLAGPVWGTILTVEVTGAVDEIVSEGGFAWDESVYMGATMTGYCVYATETPDLEPSRYIVIPLQPLSQAVR